MYILVIVGQNGTHFATDSYATNYNSYAQDYATPISTRSEDTAIYQTIGQALQPYEAPSVSMALANQMTAGEYEVPSVTKATTNESGRVYQIIEPENPTGIYHTLEPTVVCELNFSEVVADNGLMLTGFCLCLGLYYIHSSKTRKAMVDQLLKRLK